MDLLYKYLLNLNFLIVLIYNYKILLLIMLILSLRFLLILSNRARLIAGLCCFGIINDAWVIMWYMGERIFIMMGGIFDSLEGKVVKEGD